MPLGLSSCCFSPFPPSFLHRLHHILGHIFLAAPGDQQCPREAASVAGLREWCPGSPAPSPAYCGSILLAGTWQAQQSCTGEVFTFCHPRSIGRQTWLFLSQLSAPVPAGKREMLCQAGERGESWVGWWVPRGRMGQPQGQANTAHPPHSVENGGHSSLACWSQLLSSGDTRAGHPARIHRI